MVRTVRHRDVEDWNARLGSLGEPEALVFTCPECGRRAEKSVREINADVRDWSLSRVRTSGRCSGMCFMTGKRPLPNLDIVIREPGDPWPHAPLSLGEEDLLREWDLRAGTG